MITFPEELCISAYGIKCCGDNPGANPIQWVVKGDDEVIGFVSAKETFDEPYQIMQWKVKRNKYTTIEFQFSKTLGGSSFQISSLLFYEEKDCEDDKEEPQ